MTPFFLEDLIIRCYFAVFVGRQHEKDEIVKLLSYDLTSLGDSRPMVPVVPIHGAAGIGKTTLAQMIYSDDRIKEYLICGLIRVHLTDRCNGKNAMKEIYDKMTGESCGFQALESLQKGIRYAYSFDSIHLLFMSNYIYTSNCLCFGAYFIRCQNNFID